MDPGQVSAHYDKGVLKINLAKKAEAKPKQIKVTVGSAKTLEAKAPGKVAIKASAIVVSCESRVRRKGRRLLSPPFSFTVFSSPNQTLQGATAMLGIIAQDSLFIRQSKALVCPDSS